MSPSDVTPRRAPASLRLASGEEVPWVGRHVPRGTAPEDHRLPWFWIGALSVVLAMAALAAVAVGDRAGAVLGAGGVAATLVGRLLWWNREVGMRIDETTRCVVTSLRVAVVRSKGDALLWSWAPFRPDGFDAPTYVPPVAHVLAQEVAGASRRGSDILLRRHGPGAWKELVLLSPDDPDGALRAIARLMAAPSPMPATEPA